MHTEEQALRLSEQAFTAGADGVFLIDHLTQNPEVLTNAYARVRSAMGEKAYIGVNYLSLLPHGAVEWLHNNLDNNQLPDALWADYANRVRAINIPDMKETLGVPDNKLRYFGGVAFKYTPEYTDDPYEAALIAAGSKARVDVVTTSGPGTGKKVGVDKVAAMKGAIGTKELALASGIDIENIDSFRPYVDTAIVASSVETGHYSGVFDLPKLHDLVQAAHQ